MNLSPKKYYSFCQRYPIFLFPWKSLRVTHSLDFKKKSRKKIKTALDFFFLPQEKFKFTHSPKIRGCKKKTSEKKNSIFTHSLGFCRKVIKNKLFQGNKKIRYLWFCYGLKWCSDHGYTYHFRRWTMFNQLFAVFINVRRLE